MNLEGMIAAYNSGMDITEVSQMFEVTRTKTYYALKNAGVVFRKGGTPKGTKLFGDKLEALVQRNKNRIVTKERREHGRLLGLSNFRGYNGMNGYGHTKMNPNGYVIVYAPCHPNAHADGYVLMHRVLMERAIGRYLEKDEVAHHINGVRNDNRIENLLLMKSKEHQSMHMKIRNQKRRDDLLTVLR